jgi:phospholipase/carboxylesterase
MREFELAGQRIWATGGTDREGGGDGPCIVLCHGFGAPGDDLVGLASAVRVPREVRWFFPEAPIELDFGFGQTGRAWWQIDMERLQRSLMMGQLEALAMETPPGLSAAREHLMTVVAALEKEFGLHREKTVLGGFSQGAMLTTEVALHSERPWAGLAAISGALISRERWTQAAAKSGPQMHVLMTHGRRDPILPFVGAEALANLLRDASATVTFVPHGGGHEIPDSALAALETFARERLTSSAAS